MKKYFPLTLVIFGAILLVSAGVFWLETLTSSQPAGLGKTILDWFTLAAGLGASIKGWMDLAGNRKDPASANQGSVRSQTVNNSPGAEQTMRGNGGEMKQTSTDSPRSKQTME